MTTTNQTVAAVLNSALGQSHKLRLKKYAKRNRYRSVLSHRPKKGNNLSMKIWWRVKYDIPSLEYTVLYKTMFNAVENILFKMGHNKEDILSVTKTGYLWLDAVSGVCFFNELIGLLPDEKFDVGFITY